jgi:hypothetical protein
VVANGRTTGVSASGVLWFAGGLGSIWPDWRTGSSDRFTI